MVSHVDKAIRDANLGLSPTIEGTTLRIRIPELNEQRRKEMVKVAHKYSEDARVAVLRIKTREDWTMALAAREVAARASA